MATKISNKNRRQLDRTKPTISWFGCIRHILHMNPAGKQIWPILKTQKHRSA